MTANSEVVLQATGITKRYGGLTALDDVGLRVEAGELLALIGDNGAGKSTLVKTLSGVIMPDEGELQVRGQSVQMRSPLDARAQGIETVYQDLALAPNRNVAANLFLGREPVKGGFWKPFQIVDNRQMVKRAKEQLDELGVTLPTLTGRSIELMSGGQRQIVAVARAASWATSVLFLDEPTAALGVAQSRAVLDLARRIADRGIAVVLITHNMPDVMEVASRTVVMRRGRKVADLRAGEYDGERLVRLIVGAEEIGITEGAA